jgi:hypothetical protein
MVTRHQELAFSQDCHGRFTSGCITPPPASSGSLSSSSSIEVSVIPAARQHEVLVNSSSYDDESMSSEDYFHDLHMMRVSQVIELFRSLNYSCIMLLIQFMFHASIIELFLYHVTISIPVSCSDH